MMTENRTTIRGIDPDIMADARGIVRYRTDYTMGVFISEALEFFIANFDWETDEDAD